MILNGYSLTGGCNMKRELHTLMMLADAIRLIDDNMPLQTLAVFVAVAQHEPISISALGEMVGLAQSSASRNVAALSERHWLKRPGANLVMFESDPADIRRKLVQLSPKGRRVIDQLVNIIHEGKVDV